MASHRRLKQPSRTRVTVLTATAAAAVALTAQAAHADPKPTKSEVKAKVDKLYEDVDAVSQKYDGAKEQQAKLKKEVGDLEDSVARGEEDLNKLRGQLGSIASAQYRSGDIDPSVQLFLSSDPNTFLDKATAQDQLSNQQADAVKKIQAKQRTLAQERAEAQDKLKDLASTRTELGKKKQEVQNKLADARKLLSSLTAAERASIAAENQRANRDNSRPDLGNSVAGLRPRGRRPQRGEDPAGQAVRVRRHRTRLLRLLRADVLGVRTGRCHDPAHLPGPGQRRSAHLLAERPQAGRPGALLRRHAPHRHLRGQRHGAARTAHRRGRPV